MKKRMLKTVFAVFMVAAMSLGMTACSNSASDAGSGETQAASVEDTSVEDTTAAEDASVEDTTAAEDASVEDTTAAEDASAEDTTDAAADVAGAEAVPAA